MDADQALTKLEHLLDKIDPNELKVFLKRARKRIDEALSDGEEEDRNKDVILNSIRERLRDSLPLSANSSTETVLHPSYGPNSKVDPKQVIYVDSFLYDEDLFDELCDNGKLSRNFCAACGSHDVKPLVVLTHSVSVAILKYFFHYLLPSLKGKTLLDIGSRTGAILYGAYVYSKCHNIVGVEIDSTFCQLQHEIITDYEMADRITVHHQNILDNLSLVSSSDVIVMNNVFEFFCSKDDQKRLWKALRVALRKPGITLITIPSIEESLENLGLGTEMDFDWLQPVDIRQQREAATEVLFDNVQDGDELDNIYVYKT